MNERLADPIEEWRDISSRAARATGYRPRTSTYRRSGLASLVVMTAGLVVIVGALVLRPGSGPGSGGPETARADDGMFRLELTTPRAIYGPTDAIEPIAALTYLGPESAVMVTHATSPVGFRIEEVDGGRVMEGGGPQPCGFTDLTKDQPAAYPFGKSGSPDDPAKGFDRAWYEEPVLRLPVGTWRIIAMLDVLTDGCGGVAVHQLLVANTIRIVGGGESPPADSVAPRNAPSRSANLTQSPEPSASPTPGPTAKPEVGSVGDGMFRLELTTPPGTYGPNDAIKPIAAVTYLGPGANQTMYHAASPVGFIVEEIGGTRQMEGGMDLPCLSTAVQKGIPIRYPFAKAGTTEHGFDAAWYRDPVLHLPIGTWRIRAYLDIYVIDGTRTCGGIHHRLDVENVITVR